MKKLTLLICALLIMISVLPALAAPIRIFVADVNAIGVDKRDDMKTTLQMLLSSRLNSDSILTVASAAEADAIVSSTYIVIGKVYSLDALVKMVGGRTVGRAFVQGDTQEELIPAVGKLAEKLTVELAKNTITSDTSRKTVSSEFVRPQTNIRHPQSGDIVRPESFVKGSSGGMISKRLPGAASLMAVGDTLSDGKRQIFLAQINKIQYFTQGEETKLMSSAELQANEKIISLDAVDADGSGTQELYVTVVRNDEMASQIWEVKDGKLVRIAQELPYYFRAIGLAGASKKLYVQEMGRGEQDYYGDVFEANRTGANIKLSKPIKMPRFGNIYSFNQFHDKNGALMTIVTSPTNYLIVYDPDMKELWRSGDVFGATALYFQKEDSVNVRLTGDKYRWVFMNQRIIVTSKNEVMVGKNDGLFVLGNSRNYKKGAVYNFSWDGSSLEEIWRTKETQSYMPDYWYDEPKNELLILQMPQKPGPGEDGASSLAIKKVE